MIIRPERKSDEAAIGQVTEDAFRDEDFSDKSEHLILERLRKAGALSISLVAEDDGEIVGHIAFSPVALTSGEAGWFGLGPLSVTPERQGQGVGSRLVREGIDMLRRVNASGCVVLGDPDFYGRFGFRHEDSLTLADVPPHYFTVLTLREATPSGIVSYHPGFYGDAA
jgi:putative acetyltransferase